MANHSRSQEPAMALIRFILGKLILFLDWVFTPRSITRDPAQ
jgi:hypothetical protein